MKINFLLWFCGCGKYRIHFFKMTRHCKVFIVYNSIFQHLIWYGEINKYVFKVLFHVAGIFVLKYLSIDFSLPNLHLYIKTFNLSICCMVCMESFNSYLVLRKTGFRLWYLRFQIYTNVLDGYL